MFACSNYGLNFFNNGVAHLHPLTNVPTKYHGQDFIGQGHYGKVKGQINVTS